MAYKDSGPRFPGETSAYRKARDELLEAEVGLRRQIEEVAAQRRALPLGGEVPQDYEFEEWDPAIGAARSVRLSELFDDGKDTLFVYSFMYRLGLDGPLAVPCSVCTSIIDAVDGQVPHIEQHVNLAIVAKAPIERFAAHAGARGWRHARLVSSAGNSYNADYRSETADGEQFAMATVFTRRAGKIHHFWSSEIWYAPPEPGQNPRHVDFLWPLWSVFDRTPAGRPDWLPDLEYR